jgi:hypothetical protein
MHLFLSPVTFEAEFLRTSLLDQSRKFSFIVKAG